ncbi:uncharacterized protein LOC131671761 [Phymastichus coffea]|uniref:uncharacterized protein LOC131671761 n=1 Tax=Phymastichus coffea TaxID=108790 RepID=UPI00273CF20B|nr:uncharacterized protein LOC131671761 [Phymastichus coffea]
MSLWFTLTFYYFALIVGNNVFIVESALGLKVNKIADKTLPSVKRVTKKIGFDPISVPPISKDLSVATINLTDGVITGATKFKRNKNVVASIVPGIFPTARINASLYFPELFAKFNYTLEALVYTDTGTIDAVISNITAHVTLDYRPLGIKLTNPTFKIDRFGDISVNMTSDSYISWLQNVIADNAIPFFKDHIAGIAEDTVNQLVKQSVKIFNKNKYKYAVEAVFDRISKLLKI